MVPLLEKEKIAIVIRKHWLVVATEIFGIVVAMVAPLVLVIFFELSPFKNLLQGIDGKSLIDVLSFFYFLWIFIWWIGIFSIWTNYYLDEWIVTNERVITVEQKGLFYREIGSLRLDAIQNVSVEVSGFIATMFKMGNLMVETAGERVMFVMRDAENAEHCKQIISHLCKESADKMSHENLAGHIVDQISNLQKGADITDRKV